MIIDGYLSKAVQASLEEGVLPSEILAAEQAEVSGDLEKARHHNLVRKTITDKNGHITHKWVRGDGDEIPDSIGKSIDKLDLDTLIDEADNLDKISSLRRNFEKLHDKHDKSFMSSSVKQGHKYAALRDAYGSAISKIWKKRDELEEKIDEQVHAKMEAKKQYKLSVSRGDSTAAKKYKKAYDTAVDNKTIIRSGREDLNSLAKINEKKEIDIYTIADYE